MENYEYLLSFTLKGVGFTTYQSFGCYYTSRIRLDTHEELKVAAEFCMDLFEKRNDAKVESYNLLTVTKVWEL